MKNASFKYHPYYCEENIWYLCEEFRNTTAYVLVISNKDKKFPIWCHKLSSDNHQPIMWDYHVLLFTVQNKECWIYDFDSILNLPVPYYKYFDVSFPVDNQLLLTHKPFFKLFTSQEYHSEFSSTREHMKNSLNEWIQPPPSWNHILNNGKLPLTELLDFSNDSRHTIFSTQEILDELIHLKEQ